MMVVGVFVPLNSVPRVLFDGWSAEDYTALFSSENEQDVCSRTLIQFLQVCLSIAVVSHTHILWSERSSSTDLVIAGTFCDHINHSGTGIRRRDRNSDMSTILLSRLW